MLMDTYKAIMQKRDTRNYTDKIISDQDLNKILQAGRMAGSSTNKQPYEFIVIRSKDQRTAIAACGNFMEHAINAPLLVAIAMPKEHTLFDAGRAGQNMMLAAWELGISSCPVVTHDTEGSSYVLDLPDDLLVRYVIVMGYHDHTYPVGNGRARKPLDSITHFEKW